MDSDNLESTNSKMGPFADDLNINDDYYSDLIKDSNNMEPTNSKMVPFDDDSNIMDDYYLTKGQLISEWPFDVINFPKKQRKNLMNFCPRTQKLVKLEN